MERLEIHGGLPLQGTIAVQGAKNAALPMIAAAILAEGTSVLENVPDLLDIRTMAELIASLGGRLERRTSNGELDVHTSELSAWTIGDQHMSGMRSSIFLLGPLLARFGRAEAAMPGGCAIGARSIDLHLEGLQAMGATYQFIDGRFYFSIPTGRMHGARIRLRYPSVGATENLMMAAATASGETIIEHAAREPEVVNLQMMLRQMGANIEGAGSGTIVIRGVNQLHPVRCRIIPDRIAAGTWMIAAAVTGGELELRHVIREHLQPLFHLMQAGGIQIRESGEKSFVIQGRNRPLAYERIVTAPYPLFPTDLQAQIMVLMALADGNSVIRETVFEHRYQHVPALTKMGAQIRIDGADANIQGIRRLRAADLQATDLRAGAALVLAALAAEGVSRIAKTEYIDRGYETIEQTLSGAGARCIRMNDESDKRYASAG